MMKLVYSLVVAGVLVAGLMGCEQPAPIDKEPPAPVEEPVAAPEEAPEVVEEAPAAKEAEWVCIFDGTSLDGWTQRGAAKWEIKDGAMIGVSEGGQGHIYAAPELTDLEVKGTFKIDDLGGGANSGLYFRANPPTDNPDGYPKGYEAQICHNQDAFTGWLWKPGSPTGEASKMITKDGEWFDMRVKIVGSEINIWVNEELVMTYTDEEYKQGFFAIQCHNAGMTVQAKDIYYKDLSN